MSADFSKTKTKTAYRTSQHLKIMEDAGLMLFDLFGLLKPAMKPGLTGVSIEAFCLDFFRRKGMRSVLRGYNGFPSAVCVSSNEVAAHGVPDKKAFAEGDVITVDAAVEYKGFCADSAWTYRIGETESGAQLVSAAWKSCAAAVGAAITSRTISAVGRAAQDAARLCNAVVLPQFGGHGIGRGLHEAPHFAFVPVVQEPDELPVGSVINIEPVVCLGLDQPKIKEKGHAFVSEAGRFCAQFEQSLAFTEAGPKIITLPDPAILRQPMPPF